MTQFNVQALSSQQVSRRSMLAQSACGFGWLAFADLATRQAQGAVKQDGGGTHHAARAKRVIFLFMHGGPSQVDTFDYKPELQKRDGQKLPFAPASNISAKPQLMASPWKFAQHGKSGMWVSELFPQLASRVDDMCFVKSVYTRGQSHGQAVCMLHTGTDALVRPSVGAWVSYGLGSENQDLPSFISISPSNGHGGPRNYGSAFLPAIHQATTLGKEGKLTNASIPNMKSQLSPEEQRRQLDFLQSLNRDHLQRSGQDEQIEGAIESFELAYRMQRHAPEVMDLSKESADTMKLYGVGEKDTDHFARQCLLARRFAEAGVRYIELSTGNVWDQHGNLKAGHEKNAKAVDLPITGLLTDLKQRGLLEDTLVVCSGEFGRTPIVQGSNGRDHNPQGFTAWMAGGGVKGGFSYGNTDEFGYFAAENRVHMHDLHATMLHLLGVDHLRLTYRYAGRDFRLTDVYGEVVKDIFA